MVHSIMRHVAEKTQHPIEDLYERIGWPLNKKYGHAVDAFKLSITLVMSNVRAEILLIFRQKSRCLARGLVS
jgi:translation initiation factor 2 alpha subunit (eIF-2alpha)